jgi:hypothetical protein
MPEEIDAETEDSPIVFTSTATTTLLVVPEEIDVQFVKTVQVTMPVPQNFDQYGRPV